MIVTLMIYFYEFTKTKIAYCHLINRRWEFIPECEITEMVFCITRKINFMLQEIGREINTISAKSNNIDITHETLNMKNELEQIREQTQNIL